MTVLATLLGALLTAAAPVSGEPAFTRVSLQFYYDRDSLCFDSPVDLDWEAIARRELKPFPIDKPSRKELLARDPMGGSAYDTAITFSTGLPATFTSLYFYLITETGVRPITPERLLGIVRYVFPTPDNPELEGVHGVVCLLTPKGVNDAGFVAASKVPLSWQTEPAALVRSGSATRVRLESGSATLPPPGFNESAVKVKTAYILSSPELAGKYLLVRRVSNPVKADCEYIYDIYRWKKGLPVVASTAHGCDI